MLLFIAAYFYIAAGNKIHAAGVRSVVGRTDKDQIILYPVPESQDKC